MRRPAIRSFTCHTLLSLVLLCAANSAHAQPADDPGLSEPPPPPAAPPPPPPIKTPPPQIAPARRAAPAPIAAAPPVVTPPEVHETVDTKVTWISGGGRASAAGDIYELAAQSIAGPVGLMRTLTGDSGRTNQLRVALQFGVFQQSSFLVAGTGSTGGDTDSRLTGNLTIGYTPWKYIEAYFSLLNASNQNTRTDPSRTDPEVILSLGDIAFGVKGRYPVTPYIDLALHLGLKFFNSVSGVSPNGDSTNFTVDAITSLDLRKLSRVPLRFHLNFGFLVDNSLSLLPDGQCASSDSNDACIRSRVVETFAYGIGNSRFRIALAADAPLAVKSVGIEPFFEYHAEVAVGDGDPVVFNALKNDPDISSDRLTGQSLQYLTFGLRVRPIGGLVLDAGMDVGLASPGFQYGPPVPAWNVLLGVGYTYDLGAGRGQTKLVQKTITREIARGPATGRIRGVVRDSVSRKPLAGATVKYLRQRVNPQLSNEDGTFVSYGLFPGVVAIEVSRDDYEPTKIDAQVLVDGETPVEILLTAKPPAAGQLHGRVTDEAGRPVAAQVHLTSVAGSILEAESEGPGAFHISLPGGDYSLEIEAPGYLAKHTQVTIVPGQVQSTDVVLHKKPASSHVTLTKTEIAIKGTIHFASDTADIKPDGEQLLDEVADVLIKNPQVKRVRVEGHTDNRGRAHDNLELSKARAAAVVNYLVKQGIDPARLESEGYGAAQPLVPNLTPANRARNRRVVFRILEQTGGAPQ